MLENFDQVIKLAKGNPGAVTVIAQLISEGRDSDFSGCQAVEKLEKLEITGGFIWLAYKDYCKKSLFLLKMLLLEENKELIEFLETKKKELMKEIVNDGI